MSGDLFSWMGSKEKKSKKKQRESLAIRNGNWVYEDLIKTSNGNYNPFYAFSELEIEDATQNFHSSLMIRVDYFYDLYKGVHRDRAVLLKRYQHDNTQAINLSVNEIAVASTVSHTNILRLISCCLESKTSVLVYEYPSKGELPSYIFKGSQNFDPEDRTFLLKTGYEMAYALAYLHEFGATPTLLMSMRITNMYLDENNATKLCGFEFSMPIPPGENHVELHHKDVIGFVAPETVETNRFTVKSDVFGFGAILMEMLTGENVVKMLAELGRKGLRNDIGFEESVMGTVTKQRGWEKVEKEKLVEAVRVCLRCLKRDQEERPSMKEVAAVLRRILKM